MNTSNEAPSWLVYERCVAAFTLEQNSELQVTVQPNVKLTGRLSGIERQIDVLVDSRWKDGTDRRIIIDAKERKRKIDIKDIESFEGMMKDCGAARGIIVCTNGYTEAALRRAQEAITITVLTLDQLDEYEWAYEPCLSKCTNNAPRLRGMVLWAAYMGIPINGVMLIFQTGKCDGCHDFHVWCWGCGSKFAMFYNQVYGCECGYEWISYHDTGENTILLMFRVDEEYGVIIDRRPTC